MGLIKKYFVLDEESIDEGKATDQYFFRTEEVLKKKNKNPQVVAEITSSQKGILAGLEEVLRLLKNKPIDVYAMPEGSLFKPKEPVLWIKGNYLDFCRYETSLLGFLCHSSGIATKAAKIKKAAGYKNVLSFGTRRQHPAISPLIERSAYLGGIDGISNTAAGEKIGIEASGTMPHALIICFGDPKKAWNAYNDELKEEIPRIMLCDTYCDEKKESIEAAKELEKDLDAIRLDTPGSRRGDFKEIIQEVRWELDKRGYEDVEIFVSGNVDIEEVRELKKQVDGFGVGTSISSANPIDFGLDLVKVEKEFSAKRGKLGGKKQVYRNKDYEDEIRLFEEKPPEDKEPLLEPFIENGEVVKEPSLQSSRKRVLEDLENKPLLEDEN